MCLCRWMQHIFYNSSGDVSLIASKDGIILKFMSVNCLSISRSLKKLSKESVRYRSHEYLFRNYSVNYYQRVCGRIYFPVKFHAFSRFFWTSLDKCVWRKKIVLWDASHFRHSNNINTVKVSLQNFLMKLQ